MEGMKRISLGSPRSGIISVVITHIYERPVSIHTYDVHVAWVVGHVCRVPSTTLKRRYRNQQDSSHKSKQRL